MTTKKLVPRASGEGAMGVTDNAWGEAYYDTGNFNKGLFVKGSGIEDVIANTVTQGGLGGEWTKAVNGLDIYYNGGNVGIGTTSPGDSLLNVSPTAGTDPSSFKVFQNSTAGAATGRNGGVVLIDANYYQDSSDIFSVNGRGVNKLTIKGDGNVGIGTTDPAAALDVADTEAPTIHLTEKTNNYSSRIGIPSAAGHVFASEATPGSLAIRNEVKIQLGGTTPFVTIDGVNGNVGIGTASPGVALEVNGAFGSQFRISRDSNPSTEHSEISGGGSSMKFLSVSSTLGSEAHSIFTFVSDDGTDELERMRIDANGNVGIGTTNPNLAKLQIHGDSDNTRVGLLISDVSGRASAIYQKGDILKFDDYTGGPTRMAINGFSGNVGIGTANPTADLHINSKATQTAADMSVSALRFQNGDSWDNSVLINGRTDMTGATDYTDRVGLMIATRGDERIRITSAGYVGIGTPDPVGALDVVGKVYFSKIPCSNNTVPASLFTGAAMNFQPASGTFGTGKPKDIGIAFQSLHGAGATVAGETDLLFGSINPFGSNQEIMKLHSDGRVRIGRNSSENSQAGQQFYGALLPGGSLEIRAEQDTNAATAQLRIVGGSGINGTGQAVTGSLYIDNGGSASTVGKFKISQDIIGGEIHVVSSSGGVKLTSGATSWVAASDETLKENIKPLENVLDKIKDYRCVEYNLKNSPEDKKIGFIAQDWVDDFNPIVNKDEEDVLGMKYTETIPVLLKAIQEQQQLIEDLRSEVEALKNK